MAGRSEISTVRPPAARAREAVRHAEESGTLPKPHELKPSAEFVPFGSMGTSGARVTIKLNEAGDAFLAGAKKFGGDVTPFADTTTSYSFADKTSVDAELTTVTEVPRLFDDRTVNAALNFLNPGVSLSPVSLSARGNEALAMLGLVPRKTFSSLQQGGLIVFPRDSRTGFESLAPNKAAFAPGAARHENTVVERILTNLTPGSSKVRSIAEPVNHHFIERSTVVGAEPIHHALFKAMGTAKGTRAIYGVDIYSAIHIDGPNRLKVSAPQGHAEMLAHETELNMKSQLNEKSEKEFTNVRSFSITDTESGATSHIVQAEHNGQTVSVEIAVRTESKGISYAPRSTDMKRTTASIEKEFEQLALRNQGHISHARQQAKGPVIITGQDGSSNVVMAFRGHMAINQFRGEYRSITATMKKNDAQIQSLRTSTTMAAGERTLAVEQLEAKNRTSKERLVFLLDQLRKVDQHFGTQVNIAMSRQHALASPFPLGQ